MLYCCFNGKDCMDYGANIVVLHVNGLALPHFIISIFSMAYTSEATPKPLKNTY